MLQSRVKWILSLSGTIMIVLICYAAFAQARRPLTQGASSASDVWPAADETNPEYVRERLGLNEPFGTGPGQLSSKEFAQALVAARASAPSALLSTGSWTFAVPPPLANDFGGGASARIDAIAVDPSNADIVYTGSEGGLAKSTDAGGTWNYLSDSLLSQSIRSIAVDPIRPSIIYAGTGTNQGYGMGIYRSANSGLSWVLLGTSQFSGETVDKIAIDPATAGSTTTTTLYASVVASCPPSGMCHSVWKSTNSGSNWSQIKPSTGGAGAPPFTHYDIAIMPISGRPSRVFVTAPDGVFSGLGDGGWTLIHSLPHGDSTSSLAAVSHVLFLAYKESNGNTTIAKSYDFGSSWTGQSQPCASTTPFPCADVGTFGVDPVHPNRIFVGGGGLLVYSLDDGNWHNSCEPGANCVHPDIRSIAFCPTNSQRNYLGTDGGIYRADYSGSGPMNWLDKNQNLPGCLMGGLSIGPDDHITMGNQDNGTQLGWATRPPPPWSMICGGDGGSKPQIDQNNSNEFYFTALSYGAHVCDGLPCGSAGYVKKVVNGVWSNITPPEACGESQGYFAALFAAPANWQRVVMGFQNVYRSVNSGGQPVRIGGGPSGIDPGRVVVAVYEAPSNTNVIYALTSSASHLSFGGQRVFVTTNANSVNPPPAWTDVTYAPLPDGLQAVVVDPSDSQTTYLATASGVYKTSNTGSTWSKLNPPANVIYRDVAIDPVNHLHIFAASHAGVFASTDGGATWPGMPAGIPAGMAVTSLSLNATSRHLAAATYGRGAYILDLGEVRQAEAGVLTGCYIQADPNASGGYRVDGISSLGDNVAFNNFTQTTQITIRYASPYTGTFGLYVSGTRVASIPITATGPYPQGWTIFTEKIINVSIPANVTVKFQYDAGDVGINLDYIMIAR